MSTELKPRTSDINGRLWGARARDWADIQEATFQPVYEAVLERTAVGPGTRYLDVGCGSGIAAQIAARRGAEVSGIDAADALLEIARTRTPNGKFERGDLESLPFADKTFDVFTGFNSFQYAGNPVAALKPGAARDQARWLHRDRHMGSARGHGGGRRCDRFKAVAAAASARCARPIRAFRRDGSAQVRFRCRAHPRRIFDVENPFVYADEATAIRGWNSAGVAARAIENSSE